MIQNLARKVAVVGLVALAPTLSSCDPAGFDELGVGLGDDGDTVVLYFQPCGEAAAIQTVSVFVPRDDVRGWTKENIVERPVWEITARGDTTRREFEVGAPVASFNEVVAFSGELPAERMWAYVSWVFPNDSHVWQGKQQFKRALLQSGMVQADGRLMSSEEFFARDTCNPPDDYQPLLARVSPRWWAAIGAAVACLAAILAALDHRDRRRGRLGTWRSRCFIAHVSRGSGN